MSYSFSTKGLTKDEAGVAVEAELAKVVQAQPVHAADRQVAQDAAEAAIDVLTEPNSAEQIEVSVSGSLSWRGDVTANDFIGANISVAAAVRPRT